MTTIMQYPEGIYKLSNSKTIPSPTVSLPMGEASTANVLICFINRGLVIPASDYKKNAMICQTFYIQLFPTEDGFVATSPITDIYEQGNSVGDAVRNYLYSLADELLWFEAQKENLSASMLDQFHSIQSYISIV